MKSKFARFSGDRRAVQVVALYIAVGILTRLLEDAFQTSGLLPTEENSDAPIYAVATVTVLSLVWTLLASSLQLAMMARLVRPTVPDQITTEQIGFFRTIELMVIEAIRAISACLIRLPLLILPAIYEWIRLIPVPFIILFDSKYRNGEVDALKQSRDYFKNHRLRVLALIIPSAALMAAELAMTLSPEDALPLWQAPLQHAGSILGFALARLALDAFVLFMYARTFDLLTTSAEPMSNM